MINTYNGWRNYETWVVHLWMDNDEGSVDYWQDEARAHLRQARGNKDGASYSLAQAIKEQHEEAQPTVSGVWSDLMSAAIGEVNWTEIAEALLADIEDED